MEIDRGNENMGRGSTSETLIEFLSCIEKKERKKGRKEGIFLYENKKRILIRLLKIDAQLNCNFIILERRKGNLQEFELVKRG